MGQKAKGRDEPGTAKGTLGTFAGVFTPSILTILGIILFLRLGYVVGNAGLGRALIIIGLANAISILTTFSLSAIATNIKVKGGGDYYLISRTLGVEFGGAIGIVLFLAQSVSIAFYCIGFGEALANMLPKTSAHLPQIIAAFAVSFLFIFAWLGADWATRFQYLVMAILIAALVSFFVGGFTQWNSANLVNNWTPSESSPDFWILFAIFFPAVTGFTQGVSMSGDLKNAGRSLPLGTFIAVGLSILVYFGAACVLAAALPAETLSNDYGAMKRVAVFGFLIHAGVIAATLSSAMASFLGAPRILQSLSGDRIFPFLLPFAKGSGPTGNPRRGVLLSAGIAFATIGLGKLNLIAPVVSMFFLISYGLLNYATYFEARTSSPSFRPRFRWFDQKLSLLGGFACLGVMLAINISAGAFAIAILFGIHEYLKRTAGPSRWADSRRSYHLQRVRENLLSAAKEQEHPRDWRPYILAFSHAPERRESLLGFASWLEGRSGMTTVVRVLEGEGIKMLRLKEAAEKELRGDIAEYGLKAFPLVITAPNLQLAIHMLIQSSGIGPISNNTLLLNWLDQAQKGIFNVKELRYAKNLKTAFRLGCNIVILDAKEAAWKALLDLPPEQKRIDVWWWGDPTSRLMLLLAYLITRHESWNEAKIRVLAVHEKESHVDMEELKNRFQEVRIDAEPEIITEINMDEIVNRSADASLVFLPFRLGSDQVTGPLDAPLDDLISRLPVVALILAAEDIDLAAEPEEGRAGEIAAALDALEDAEKKAKEAEKAASETAEEVQKRMNDLESAVSAGAGEDLMGKVREIIEVKGEAEKAVRKVGKAEARVNDAIQALEKLGVKAGKEDDEEMSSVSPPELT